MPTTEEIAEALEELISGKPKKYEIVHQQNIDPSARFRKALGLKVTEYEGRPRYVIHRPGADWSLHLTEKEDGTFDVTVTNV